MESQKTEYQIGKKKADIVLLTKDKRPILVIETKHYDPISSGAVDQALSYARESESFFAATDGESFLLFRTPRSFEIFLLKSTKYGKHR